MCIRKVWKPYNGADAWLGVVSPQFGEGVVVWIGDESPE